MAVAASALLWPGSGGFPALPVAQARPGRPHGDEQLSSKRENLNRRCLPCFSVCSDIWVRLESGRCAARTRRYDQHSRARPELIRPVSPLPPEIGAVSPFFNPAMDLCRAGPPFCGRRQLVVPPRWSSPRWSPSSPSQRRPLSLPCLLCWQIIHKGLVPSFKEPALFQICRSLSSRPFFG